MKLLFPREHGAYGQLLLPLGTALVLHGTPRLCTGLLALAACLLFWAHEPLLLLLGQRGTRQKREQGRRARWLLPLLVLATLLSLLGALADSPQLVWLLLLPLGLGLFVLPFVMVQKEKSTLPELLVALALSSWAVPLQASKGVALGPALHLWGTLGFLFCVAVLSVRGLLGRLALGWSVALAVLGLSVYGGLSAYGVVPRAGIGPLVPTVVLAMGLGLGRPGPQALRPVGWAIVAATVVVIGLLSRMG